MYYKYRGVTELKYLLDIFLNKRLFAAQYFNMNDPMEGYYRYTIGDLSNSVMSAIKSEKSKIGICSLSRTKDNNLMWAHYAEGHKGIVIGVEINANKYDVEPVKYDEIIDLSIYQNHDSSHLAKEILSHKYKIWGYEEEVRIFVKHKSFIQVNVREVIFGCKMAPKEKQFFNKLISKLVENVEFSTANLP